MRTFFRGDYPRRSRPRRSVGRAGGWVAGVWPGPRARSCRVQNVVHGAPGAPGAAVGPGRVAFSGEGVAVPAVEGEAAAQFALFARLFVAVPLRAGFGAVSVVGVGAFA